MRVMVNNSRIITGVIISLTLATILGIFAQNIAYFLNEHNPIFGLKKVITVVTFLSVGLYIINPVLLIKFLKVKKGYLVLCVIASVLIGFLISKFSVFVWAMWMG